jgi:hypothetical protein
MTNNQYITDMILNTFKSNNKLDQFKHFYNLSHEDLTGVAEAYKHGAMSEEEMQEQVKVFMNEYTYNLIGLMSGKGE